MTQPNSTPALDLLSTIAPELQKIAAKLSAAQLKAIRFLSGEGAFAVYSYNDDFGVSAFGPGSNGRVGVSGIVVRVNTLHSLVALGLVAKTVTSRGINATARYTLDSPGEIAVALRS